MSQPKWVIVDNIGDEDPLEYGGFFIYKDKTGEFCEEAEVLHICEEQQFEVFRFKLKKCTFINNVLSDNQFDALQRAWFATDISEVSEFSGIPLDDIYDGLCSDDPIERAQVYRAISDYHGLENFDNYRLIFHKKSEVRKRYQSELRTLRNRKKS